MLRAPSRRVWSEKSLCRRKSRVNPTSPDRRRLARLVITQPPEKAEFERKTGSDEVRLLSPERSASISGREVHVMASNSRGALENPTLDMRTRFGQPRDSIRLQFLRGGDHAKAAELMALH